MAGIFTRKSIAEIMQNEGLTPEERTDQVFSLYGKAIDDGFITKGAAKAAQDEALNNAKAEWEKSIPKPNIKESDEYKTLLGEFDAYKAMQTARTSDDFKGIKPKFFETVYSMIDRTDGAKPIKEQIEGIQKDFEEYFESASAPENKPTFGSPDKGGMPKGDEGAVSAFEKAWGFAPRK